VKNWEEFSAGKNIWVFPVLWLYGNLSVSRRTLLFDLYAVNKKIYLEHFTILHFSASFEPAIIMVMNLARRSFPPGHFSAVRITGCYFIRKRIGSFPVFV
jgi:hypothetical protein